MTRQDVLSVGVRVLGVICLVYAVFSSTGLVASAVSRHARFYQGDSPMAGWYLADTIAIPALLLIVAFVLLKWGDPIARRMAGGEGAAGVTGEYERRLSVLRLCLRIVGAAALVRGVRDMVAGAATMAIEKAHYGMIGSDTLISSWPKVIVGLVLLLIGGYLVTGAKDLVRLLCRAGERVGLGGVA